MSTYVVSIDPATDIGVALALPGLMNLAIKYGQWVWGRVQTLGTRIPHWRSFPVFSASLARGKCLVNSSQLDSLVQRRMKPGIETAARSYIVQDAGNEL